MSCGVFVDLGGVLVANPWPAIAARWAARLRRSERAFMAAVFAGSDDQVLIGRVTEAAWWDAVRHRLQLDAAALTELRDEIASHERWDADLVAALRRIRGAAAVAIVSNAWPDTRARIAAAGMAGLADELILSAEVGVAKPDRRIFELALSRLRVDARRALYVDDTQAHVDAAAALGMLGHVHRDAASTIAAIERFVQGAR